MSRPRKTGLDYFPHDVDSSTDDKIESLEAIHGVEGYAFYFKILERVYRAGGFWRVSGTVSAAETPQIFCRKRMQWAAETWRKQWDDMLGTCLRYDLFDQDAYERTGCITSNGIQARVKEVRRKRVVSDSCEFPRDIRGVSAAETMPETGESKVNKSKEKKTKDPSSVCVAKLGNGAPPESAYTPTLIQNSVPKIDEEITIEPEAPSVRQEALKSDWLGQHIGQGIKAPLKLSQGQNLSNGGTDQTPKSSNPGIAAAENHLVDVADPRVQGSSAFVSAGRRPMKKYPELWFSPVELYDATEILRAAGLPDRHRPAVFKRAACSARTKIAAGAIAERLPAFNWVTGWALEDTLRVVKSGNDAARSEAYLERAQ